MKNRKVHINNEIWQWVVEPGQFGEVKEVRIYSPDKKLYRINGIEIAKEKRYVGLEGELTFTITPSVVKSYILKNLCIT